MIEPPAGTPGPRATRLTPHLILGLLIISVGVLLTLDNLGLVHAEDYLRYWPAALVAAGLAQVWRSTRAGGIVGGFLLTFAGVWLLLENLALIRISLADMWPLLIVFVGAYLVWQGVAGGTPAPPEQDSDAAITAVAVLSGVERGSNARAFRRADLTAIMGACEIDLRSAAINGDAVINVFAMWGGIEIRVPEDWTVVTEAIPLLGGVEDTTRAPQGAAAHRLTLRGLVIMGGVEIMN